MRARGLKLYSHMIHAEQILSRPHAGAWIEISWEDSAHTFCRRSRPHAGAWIEMCQKIAGSWCTSGRAPMRARGLKSPLLNVIARASGSRPHAGAWIEISRTQEASSSIPSRPTRARGLKLRQSTSCAACSTSSARMRMCLAGRSTIRRISHACCACRGQ